MYCKQISTESLPSIDITEISYTSDGEILNSTVWLRQSFKPFDKSWFDEYTRYSQPQVIYEFAKLDGVFDLSSYVKQLIGKLKKLEPSVIDIIETTTIQTENGKTYKILFETENTDKYLWFFTINDNQIYKHSFVINKLYYKTYLPIIEKIINSIEFTKYDNNLRIYDNPSLEIKFQYPGNSKYIEEYSIDNKSDRWNTILSIFNSSSITSILNQSNYYLDVFAKNNKTDFIDFKNEMIELYGGYGNIVNYTNEFQNEKTLIDNINNSILFSVTQNNTVFNVLSSLIMQDEKSYAFSYINDEKSFLLNLPAYKQIINSIQFIKYNNTSLFNYVDYEHGINIKYPQDFIIIDYSDYLYGTDFYLKNALLNSPIEVENNSIPIFNLVSKNSIDIVRDIDNNNTIDNKNNFLKLLRYMMVVDIISEYDKGVDYAYEILWNRTSYNWDRIFYELSSSQKRVITIENNVSDFYGYKNKHKMFNKHHITFSIDLQKINNPTNYKIMFISSLNIHSLSRESECSMADSTPFLPIPPSDYTINPLFEFPLILYQNGEKEVEFEIQYTSPVENIVYLQEDKSRIKNDTSINTTFLPNKDILTDSKKNIFKLKIVTNNTELRTHTIPILANITFPEDISINLLRDLLNFTNYRTPNSIPVIYDLNVEVYQNPPWYRPAIEFSENTIQPFGSLIVSIFIPIISAIIGILMYFKKVKLKSKKI